MVAVDSNLLRIGELSHQSQVLIKTIRYYEELGLLQATGRTSGGFRLFKPNALTRLAFIKRAQGLGLSLQEIHHILDVHDQGQRPCHEVKQTLQEKVQQIEDRMAQLSLLRQELLALIDGAEGLVQADASICPIIENTG
ncbi:heavy metal-responsive transcriptional regulator [Pseudanabaena sp. FACHB-2040]|uniref:heavy metal-responsive transcriptional regulator n=1 Tax=Pseudanabaena sp. FACHB-2040 TaxID=2692859 RepID=UPI001688B3AB|nr:heavy metal-responsive transcriptional regulator [Pseudanabaena sp. FACHB-2040]MBD2256190.1 heavy metal-responsive transcriptional regulator [Pseudanabaena sp. FACHB-2040]